MAMEGEDMNDFISTETAILLSLLDKEMPNLGEYINKYSALEKPQIQADNAQLVKILSDEKISNARKHPSAIILYALNAVAKIYGALHNINHQVNDLVHEREKIENILIDFPPLKEKSGPK